MPKLPLEGFRILDMTVVWAGTYCATLLADMGAEVIRIESTKAFVPLTRGLMAHPTESLIKNSMPMLGGMPGRVPGARPWNRSPTFNAHARNKLSMTVDLLQPRGMEMFKRLVKTSDVFVENNVSETMDKLGISYDMLKEQNPDIIMLRMPAYGNTGQYKNFRSLGIHMEGTIGHSLLRGYADMDSSANTPVYVADAAGGAQGAFAVMAALHYRKRTGKGQLIELAQAENALPYLGQFFMDYSMNARNGSTIGNRHPYAIQGCYPCAGEDRWVNITLFDDRDWEAFCKAIGNPEWSKDERFANLISRHNSHDEIDTHISEWTRQRDHYEVMRLLQDAGVAAGAVMDQRDAYNDPHLNERGMFEEVTQEDTGTHLYPGAPFKMTEPPLTIRRGPVRLGEDNEYVYKTLLEVSDEEYAELEREGHIGMDYDESVP
ncbi:MAG: CoA transferase [Chloroflexi bacterium]|nr:CoA transferase [Chloroflexota bacterium]